MSKGTERGTIISDCTFQNCGTKAVYSEKYDTTFINCSFKNNTNTQNKGPGALRFSKGHFSIYICTFIGNVGSMDGGALIVDSENIVDLDNLTFIRSGQSIRLWRSTFCFTNLFPNGSQVCHHF